MGNDPTNAHTKQSLRLWIEQAIRKSQSPDPREEIKRKRQAKRAVIAKKYGL